MSILSKLFGGGKSDPVPVEHDGFSIFAEPMSEGGAFRIAARIEKEIGGTVKRHQMVRADTLPSKDAAEEASVNKAKMLIAEQGDAIFR